MKKTGRPCKYSTKLMERICELIAEGKSERQIGRMKGLPSPATMRRWKLTHPEFGRRSAIAREESAALYRELALEKAMECSEIADKIIKGTFVNASGQHVSEVPRGVAELAKLYIQEMNREAALRDDRRFGDRQRVALTGMPLLYRCRQAHL